MNNNQATPVRGDTWSRRSRLVVASATVALTLVAGAFTAQIATADDPFAPQPGNATSPELSAAADLAFSYQELWVDQKKGRSLTSTAEQSIKYSKTLVKKSALAPAQTAATDLKTVSAQLPFPGELSNQVVADTAAAVYATEGALDTNTDGIWSSLYNVRKAAVQRAEYIYKNANKATKNQRANIRKAEKRLAAAVSSRNGATHTYFKTLAKAVEAAEKHHAKRHGKKLSPLEPVVKPPVVTPPTTDSLTTQQAQEAVERAWSVVPLPDTSTTLCVYRNYGTWSAGSTPPPPTAVSVGAYIAYTAYADKNVGYVQYYACEE